MPSYQNSAPIYYYHPDHWGIVGTPARLCDPLGPPKAQYAVLGRGGRMNTIRIRTMFFIEGFLNIRGDIIPLNVDSCDNYPYFQNHNSILNNDSLYLKYF